MYWFNHKKRIVLILLCSICCTACRPDIKETGSALKYFDAKGYFSADAGRLNRLNITVFKTVSHNNVTESKKVTIKNWNQELDLFIGSDINKPAWKNSYTIINEGGLLLYKADEPDLTMREMLIKKDGQKIKWIVIFNRTENILYKSTEKLTYYPDSLYLIEKDQHVKLMGNNHYSIKGVLLN